MAARPETGPTHPAVVVALDCITGLQTARILAARGVPVVGVAADRRHFCARTRVVRRVVESPTAGDALIGTLERLGPELGDPAGGGPAVLIPCSDASVLAISAERERLAPWFRFVLPAHEVVELLTDKIRFTEHAQAHGLAIPATRILRSRADAEAAAAELDYPAVMKPGLKSARWQAATRAKVFRVEDAAGLLATYDRCSEWTDVLIAQAWVDGVEADLYSSNVYFDRASQPQVTFIARKIRQWPVETGTSCLGVEVRNDAVLDESIRLFASVAYQGLGYLEMKRDARTGRHLIIEPNIGRPTGRSAIAERGGVELIMTAYRDALGEPLPAARVQRYRGVKWIYWRHDLQASIVAARHGRLSLRGWWRSVRGPKIEAVGSWRDPVPFLIDGWRTVTVVGADDVGQPGRPAPTPSGARPDVAVARGAAAAVAATPVFGGIVRALEAADRDRPDVLPVLTYHRVAEPDDDHYPGLISASPAGFAEQVEALGRRFSFVGLDRVLERGTGGRPIPPRSLLLTFDDAYRDFAESAWPVLRARGIPAVLFVPTAFPDSGLVFWWDRLYAALIRTERTEPLETAAGALGLATRADRLAAFRTLRGQLKQLAHPAAMATVDRLVDDLGAPVLGSSVLGWGDLRRLAGEGVTLAAHSRVHPLLERVDPADLDAEIDGSRTDLAREIGTAPPAFAYPSGSHSETVVARVRALGIEAAFTTDRGVNDLRKADWQRLRRINVGGRSSPALIRAQGLGWLAR